jgi:predicted MFS family arabinose efflux permease
LQIPAGMIIDRFGVRKISTLACSFVAIGCWIFSQSETLQWGILGRIFMGAGGAFSFISMLKAIKDWFTPKQFPILLGIVETVGMGSVAGINTGISKITQIWGWRISMIGCACSITLLTVLLWFAVQDKPREAVEETQSNIPFSRKLQKLFRMKELWLCGIYAGCTFSIVTVFTYLWCVPFLTQGYGISEVTAVMLCSFIYVGIAIGSPILGWITNRTSSSTLMFRAALLSLILFSTLLYVPGLPVWSIATLIFALGMIIATYQLSFTYVSRAVPTSVQSTANGAVNMMTMIGAPLLQPVVGLFLSYNKDGSSFDGGAEAYSGAEYRMALSLIPICLFIALLCAKSLQRREQARG